MINKQNTRQTDTKSRLGGDDVSVTEETLCYNRFTAGPLDIDIALNIRQRSAGSRHSRVPATNTADKLIRPRPI